MKIKGRSVAYAVWLLSWAIQSWAAVTPELQKLLRQDTFEVVMKKPEKELVSYEKPLPLELLPFIERTDAYRSIGTAFALGHNTYVTAAHVFIVGIGSQFGAPALRTPQGTVYEIDNILKFSSHEDFVVFSLRKDAASTGFGVNRSPMIDQPVLAVGNALGEGIVIRDGLYTSETPEAEDGRWNWIRFSAAASPGNSGGPLCDDKGQVIGIVIGKSPNENLNYAMPISRVVDDTSGKARFEQRLLVKAPYLHGSVTYPMKEEFALPLPWPEFVKAFQKTLEKNVDMSHSQLFDAYAGTLFPRGPGTDDIFFATDSSDLSPRLISQRDDGAWSAESLTYRSIDLPGDGVVAAAAVTGAQLVRLVRPNTGSDDAFYADSKTFMDIVLRAIDFERPVGPDKVKVTSLGRAINDHVFTDVYGRKWQERMWAVPYADAYLLGLLLPTPDGYDAIITFAPSNALYSSKRETRSLAGQLSVSYNGTVAQWQAMLLRKSLLPDALKEIVLTKTPTWTLSTPRFTSRVPPSVLAISESSPLSVFMGFVHVGDRASWEPREIWWSTSNRHDEEVGVWRRPQPSSTAKLELRNQFDALIARRAPYDGTVNRETAEIYAASKVLDVRGAKPGSVSSDLVYGITIHTTALADETHSTQALQDLSRATEITEMGNGANKATSAVIPRIAGSLGDQSEKRDFFRKWIDITVDQIGASTVDMRDRTLDDDVKIAVQEFDDQLSPLVVAQDATGFDVEMTREAEKFKWLFQYWR